MKRLGKFKLLVAVLSSALAGCTSTLVVSQSHWHRGTGFEAEASGNDEKTGINWWVSNDSSMLYLKFSVPGRSTQDAVMKDGYALYFDKTGEKKKQDGLSFSMKQDKKQDKRPQGRPPVGQRPEMSENQGEPGPRPEMSGIFNQATWKGITIDMDMERTDFASSFKLDSSGVFACIASVPLRNMSLFSLQDSLAIGIEITQKSGATPGGGQPQGGPGKGGAPGGGGGSGMGGMGGGPGGESGGAPPEGGPGEAGSNDESSTLKARIWFITHLAIPD